MKTTLLNLSELQPYYRNARRGNVDAIAESLQVNGQYKPIIVNEGTQTGRPWEVLVGNHTVQAAEQIGLDKLDAVVIDVDDDRARRIVLADNRTADLATYDDALLADLLSEADLAGTGFSDADLDGLLGGGEAIGSADVIGGSDTAGITVEEQYAVTVVVGGPAEQEKLYDELSQRFDDVRAVTV